MIHFNCPGCGKLYQVPDEVAGKSAKCRHCGRQMQIPIVADGTLEIIDDPQTEPMPATAEATGQPASPSMTNIPAPLRNQPQFERDINAFFGRLKRENNALFGAWGPYQWLAVVASLLCFVAGCKLCTIQSAASRQGEGRIFESAFRGIGLYFIAKAFFIGPLLFSLGRHSHPIQQSGGTTQAKK